MSTPWHAKSTQEGRQNKKDEHRDTHIVATIAGKPRSSWSGKLSKTWKGEKPI